MWTVLGPILGGLAGILAGFAAYRSVQQQRVANQGQQAIKAVEVSISSLQAALAESHAERIDVRAQLVAERSAHDQTRADLRTLRREFEDLRTEVRGERRRHADTVKVLVRQIRSLGQEPAGGVSDDADD